MITKASLRRAASVAVLRTSGSPVPAVLMSALSVIVGIATIVRGIDLAYLSRPPAPTTRNGPSDVIRPTINYAVDYLGHDFWGVLLIVGGILILLATMSRRVFPLLGAHIFGAAVYFAYAVVLAQGLIIQDSMWGGIRFVVTPVASCGYCVIRVIALMIDLRTREYEE